MVMIKLPFSRMPWNWFFRKISNYTFNVWSKESFRWKGPLRLLSKLQILMLQITYFSYHSCSSLCIQLRPTTPSSMFFTMLHYSLNWTIGLCHAIHSECSTMIRSNWILSGSIIFLQNRKNTKTKILKAWIVVYWTVFACSSLQIYLSVPVNGFFLLLVSKVHATWYFVSQFPQTYVSYWTTYYQTVRIFKL